MKKQRSKSYEPAKFPLFEHGHVIPPKIYPTGLRAPNVVESFSLAIYMASQIDGAHGSVRLRVEQIRSGYFRAALAELIRVEEMTSKAGATSWFAWTDDPLLHVIKLLRNYEIHIGKLELAEGSVPIQWNDQVMDMSAFIVDNLSAERLRNLDSADGYTDMQLEELVSLFDGAQRKFGVVQLLYNTCLHVAQVLKNREK